MLYNLSSPSLFPLFDLVDRHISCGRPIFLFFTHSITWIFPFPLLVNKVADLLRWNNGFSFPLFSFPPVSSFSYIEVLTSVYPPPLPFFPASRPFPSDSRRISEDEYSPQGHLCRVTRPLSSPLGLQSCLIPWPDPIPLVIFFSFSYENHFVCVGSVQLPLKSSLRFPLFSLSTPIRRMRVILSGLPISSH